MVDTPHPHTPHCYPIRVVVQARSVLVMTHVEWLQSFTQENRYEAAEAALTELRVSKKARTLLVPIIAEALLMHRRNDTRTVERSVPISAVLAGETSLDVRRSRLQQTVPLVSGGSLTGKRVRWGDMTVEQHRERIAFLNRHIKGVQRTIGEHEQAVAAIEAAGVSCLNDLEAAA